MESLFDDSRRHLLHQRLARRWIRDGGVVIANGAVHTGAVQARRSTFEFAETISSSATLQVTFNLREVGKACKFLNNYAMYLWNCDHEGEYILLGFATGSAVSAEALERAPSAPRQHRRLAPTCYGGRHPNMELEVHDVAVSTPVTARPTIMARMLLPPGLCAAIYQPASADRPNNWDGRLISISTKETA